MMKYNTLVNIRAPAAAILVFAAFLFGGVTGCTAKEEKVELVTIGMIDDITNTLVFIAEEKDFFTAGSLDVTIKQYDTGSAATDAVLKGEVDIAAATEFVIVGKAFQKEEISIVATRAKSQSIYLVARKDRGIESIAGLKGKRIGLPKQSINEFYLNRLLYLQGLDLRDITLVNVSPAQTMTAISSGDVDAVITRQSLVDQIKQWQPDGMFIWSANSNQPSFGVMAGRNDWITGHREVVKRFLDSLLRAEKYVIANPTEARAIIQKRMKFEDAYMAEIWPKNQFSLSLDQPLIIAMKDEAQWMIKNNLTGEKAIPDFSNYIYLDALKAVRPEAVSVIR